MIAFGNWPTLANRRYLLLVHNNGVDRYELGRSNGEAVMLYARRGGDRVLNQALLPALAGEGGESSPAESADELPPLPVKYAWIREGVPVAYHSGIIGFPPSQGLVSKKPWFLNGQWVAEASGMDGRICCDWLSPLGEVESVVWCQDLTLAPFRVPLMFRSVNPSLPLLRAQRQTHALWEMLPRVGEPSIKYGPDCIHSWAFPLRGPRS
jgi:hypothetical protein